MVAFNGNFISLQPIGIGFDWIMKNRRKKTIMNYDKHLLAFL